MFFVFPSKAQGLVFGPLNNLQFDARSKNYSEVGIFHVSDCFISDSLSLCLFQKDTTYFEALWSG